MTGTVAALVQLLDPVPDADGTPIARFTLPRAGYYPFRSITAKCTAPGLLIVTGVDEAELPPEEQVSLAAFGTVPFALATYYSDSVRWHFLGGVGGGVGG